MSCKSQEQARLGAFLGAGLCHVINANGLDHLSWLKTNGLWFDASYWAYWNHMESHMIASDTCNTPQKYNMLYSCWILLSSILSSFCPFASSFLCHLDPLRVVMPWPPCIATVRLWESTQLRTSHSAVSLCPQFGPEATALPFEPQSLSVPISHRVWRMGKAMETSILTRFCMCPCGKLEFQSTHPNYQDILVSYQSCSFFKHVQPISLQDLEPNLASWDPVWEKLWMAAVSYSHNFPNRKIVLPMADEGRVSAKFDLTLLLSTSELQNLKSKDSLNATIECPALPAWHNLAVKKADGNRCIQATPAQLFAAWSQIMSGNSMWHLPIGIQLHGGTKGCSGFMVNGLWIVAVKPHLFRTERKDTALQRHALNFKSITGSYIYNI